MSKERLDVLLVNRGLIESRSKAKAVIMAGEVFVDGQREDKAGAMFPEEVHIELRGKQMPYVSRGGFKLEKALKVFDISLEGLICMDVGSSTGGFTDCMLQNGAVRVYAVDVGTNQLAWKLRQDDRVVVMEKTNIRYLTPEDMVKVLDGDGPDESEGGADVRAVGADDTSEESRGWTGVDFASIDVAFISLEKVFAPLHNLLKEKAEVVALIKPQFEAGREQVGKKGVVREPSVHEDVIKRVVGYAVEAGYTVLGLDHSPIRGPEGNIEYLLHLSSDKTDDSYGQATEGIETSDDMIKKLVSSAHEELSVH